MPFNIPKPEDYDVSLKHGFLPHSTPHASSLDLRYAPWVDIVNSLPQLLAYGRLRSLVDLLPVLECDRLTTTPQLRCAYSILAFISHAYIWGGDSPAEPHKIVPPPIAIPFLAVCKALEMLPVATYAAVVLWNFDTILSTDRRTSLCGLKTLTTFTGAIDESWFYLVSVAIEAQGGPLISTILEATRCAHEQKTAFVIIHLRQLAAGLTELGETLKRLHERCDPAFFYDKLRPYLAGGKNMATSGLPHGVMFDDGTQDAEYVQLAGGSNAQSSLFQLFDIALGIAHQATSGTVEESSTANPLNAKPEVDQADGLGAKQAEPDYITDMRLYMPEGHRRFLRDFSRVAIVREFVASHPHQYTLMTAYKAAVAALVAFRDVHLQIVGRYIVLRSQRQKAASQHAEGIAKDLNGTGGTTLIPFLRQVRDETALCAA
ncbi:tryptophan 2,3- dioxygenase [Recurvomyces mirabilis]|nr:tryptophan 2,3- dioxygenase [Recurvomyces mirabilis]